MAKEITVEALRGMTVHKRHALYKNACRLGHTAEGAALKKMIEEAGLPYSEAAALRGDDPITLKMHEIIWSPAGKQAALAATEAGEAAMAGIDPLLQIALGSDYGAHNMATNRAGVITGELMQSLGYRQRAQIPLPANCVAKSATAWVRRTS
jgi:hypothetical protein